MFIRLQEDSDTEEVPQVGTEKATKPADDENVATDTNFERITDYEAHTYLKRVRDGDVNFISLWTFIALRKLIPRRAFPKSLRLKWFFDYFPTEVTLLTNTRRITPRQVLEYLSPYDLYHLMKANKVLYQFLGSRFFASRWKYAFQDTVYPPCPPDVSWLFWTEFLFSPRLRCYWLMLYDYLQACGGPGKVFNIGLWSHWCRKCTKVELVDNKQLGVKEPDMTMLGYELVPRGAQFCELIISMPPTHPPSLPFISPMEV
ncbi:hypothetical protein BDN72DRAFT_907219 [Pluteus cervinus]|uniref:Uncharacterized protein n=1 Tax=Pluteus cervinus TaxID=181527 RepID=A0ACD2ZXL2_9AGAR|nr:hypothetical protein BDN72DRAFT_907219 [Pluteus cervinus]